MRCINRAGAKFMILDSDSISTTTNDSVRLQYQTPRLTVFGSVASLTETGSRDGMEDGRQNGWCSNLIAMINTTYDMC